jgi:hypothetical protein
MVVGTSFGLVGDMPPPPFIGTEVLVGSIVAIAMIVLGIYFARRMRRQK